jgi:hypothetical protein
MPMRSCLQTGDRSDVGTYILSILVKLSKAYGELDMRGAGGGEVLYSEEMGEQVWEGVCVVGEVQVARRGCWRGS